MASSNEAGGGSAGSVSGGASDGFGRISADSMSGGNGSPTTSTTPGTQGGNILNHGALTLNGVVDRWTEKHAAGDAVGFQAESTEELECRDVSAAA